MISYPWTRAPVMFTVALLARTDTGAAKYFARYLFVLISLAVLALSSSTGPETWNLLMSDQKRAITQLKETLFGYTLQ